MIIIMARATIRTEQDVLLDDDVRELPGIALVDVLGEERLAIGEWVPAGIDAGHLAEIGHLNFKTAAEIDLVRFDDAGLWIFDRPDHPGEHGARHLQARGIL